MSQIILCGNKHPYRNSVRSGLSAGPSRAACFRACAMRCETVADCARSARFPSPSPHRSTRTDICANRISWTGNRSEIVVTTGSGRRSCDARFGIGTTLDNSLLIPLDSPLRLPACDSRADNFPIDIRRAARRFRQHTSCSAPRSPNFDRPFKHIDTSAR